MTLVKRKPWSQFFASPIFSESSDFPSLIDWTGSEMFPAVNVIENDKNYEIEVAVPGFHKEDFKVNLDNSSLTISAERKDEKEKKEKNYKRREFTYNSFQRTFSLPENVNRDGIEANYKDGVLNLKVTKLNKGSEKGKRSISVK